jgi:dihydrofolate reductase
LDRGLELDDALVFVAGGGQVYRATWDRLDALEITEVDQEPDGDVLFPHVEPRDWREVSRDPHQGVAFVRYIRRR